MNRTYNAFAIALTGLTLGFSADMVAAQSVTANATAQSNSSVTAQEMLVAQNQTYLDVMANLEASGYEVLEVSRTWLGRIKIEARNNLHLREVVVSTSTGEVMSDVVVEIYAQNQTTTPETGETTEGESGIAVGVTLGVTGGVSTGSGGSSAGGSSNGGVSISIGN